MFRFLIVAALIACSLAATIQDATETEEFKQWSGRIVGGEEARPGQFPYQASMRSAANAHFCGGSLLNRRWVVCAGKTLRSHKNSFKILIFEQLFFHKCQLTARTTDS